MVRRFTALIALAFVLSTAAAIADTATRISGYISGTSTDGGCVQVSFDCIWEPVATMTITFSGPDTALMTWPSGRTTNLKRHLF